MNIDITKINGAEILEFLNNLLNERGDDVCDISMRTPFIFEAQEIKDNEYRLHFSVYYNNWGTHQLIEDNIIKISEKDGVTCWPEEPFDGDGTAETLEDALTKWLETHEFNLDREHIFQEKMKEIYEVLPQISFNETKMIDNVIEKLNVIKTYMI